MAMRVSRPEIIWKDDSFSEKVENLGSNIDCSLVIDVNTRKPTAADENLSKHSTYEQLITEIAKRNLAAQEEILFEHIKKTYHFQKQLGKGSSGVVHLVYHKDLNKRFACKVIEKSGPLNDLQSMRTEVEIMKRVKHSRVISLFELYESPKCMWLILELVEAGGLRSKMSTMKKRFPEAMTAKFVKQILEGLQYLHNQGIVHRDVKIDNILFEGSIKNGSVKLADFGLSALLKTEDSGYPKDPMERKKYRGLKSAWGTPTHYSPELISGSYGPQTDMWSLGCVVYEMLTGFNAFPPSNNRADQHKHKDLFRRIKSCNYRRTNLIHVSPSCRDFISKLLELSPLQRMCPEEALKHPWIISSQVDGVEKLVKPRNMNPLKLLNCIRSRSSTLDQDTGIYLDSPRKESENTCSAQTDLTSERKRSPESATRRSSVNSSFNTNTNTAANSPDGRKPSASRSLFTSLCSAILGKETRPNTPTPLDCSYP